MLEKGQAGLIVIYATNMADQVAASIKAENKYVSDAINADADALVKQMKAAETSSRLKDPRGRGAPTTSGRVDDHVALVRSVGGSVDMGRSACSSS